MPLLIDTDILNRAKSPNPKLEIKFSRSGLHLENQYNIISPLRMDQSGRNSAECNDMPSTVIWLISKPEAQFQYGGRLFFQTGNSYISDVD